MDPHSKDLSAFVCKLARDSVPEFLPFAFNATDHDGEFVTVTLISGDSFDVAVLLEDRVANVAQRLAAMMGLCREESLHLIVGERILEAHELIDEFKGMTLFCAVQRKPQVEGHEQFFESVVVMDIGSYSCKVGFAGEKEPRSIFRNQVAPPKIPEDMLTYIGDDITIENAALEKIRYPVNGQIVTSWDDMEKIWHHVYYNVLRLAPEDCPVILTEAPLTPKANREKSVQVMFETFNVAALHVASTVSLSMCLCRRPTGVLVDIGFSIGHVAPIYEGCLLAHAVRRIDTAGATLSEHLHKLFLECGRDESLNVVREFKETSCYVAFDYDKELLTLNEASRVCIRCPEVLFQPDLVGIESKGLHALVHESLQCCATEQQDALLSSIVLAGGSTLLPGIDVRLRKELFALNGTESTRVIVHPGRHCLAWLGASDIASLSLFDSMWTTKEEYDCTGPSIVHRRPW